VFSFLPAVPVYWQATPTAYSPFFRKPISSAVITPRFPALQGESDVVPEVVAMGICVPAGRVQEALLATQALPWFWSFASALRSMRESSPRI
jgi:hypothetical protein